MEKTILNFHFDYLNPSLSLGSLLCENSSEVVRNAGLLLSFSWKSAASSQGVKKFDHNYIEITPKL